MKSNNASEYHEDNAIVPFELEILPTAGNLRGELVKDGVFNITVHELLLKLSITNTHIF